MRRPHLRVVWALGLGALLALPSEWLRPTATSTGLAVSQGGEVRVNYGAGQYGAYRRQLAGFATRADALVEQIDQFYPSRTYCTAAERAADEATLKALQAAYDALVRDFTNFKNGIEAAVEMVGVMRQFLGAGDNPKDPNFWASANREILDRPRDALKTKQQEFNASKVIDCSQPGASTVPPPPPPPTSTTPAAPRANPLPGLKRPDVPDIKIPAPPGPFCSEEERRAWIKAHLQPLLDALIDACNRVRMYGDELFYLPKSDDPAVNKARDAENQWESTTHDRLDKQYWEIAKIRDATTVINCAEKRVGLGPSPLPAPAGSGSFVVRPSADGATGDAWVFGPGSGALATDALVPPEALLDDHGPAYALPQIFGGIVDVAEVPGLRSFEPRQPPSLLAAWFSLLEPAVLARTRPSAPSTSPLQALFISLGTATGDAFDAQIINDGDRAASLKADGVVLEAVGRDRQDRVRKQMQDAVNARGPQAPPPTVSRITAYCLEYTKQPPVQGTIFRLADTQTQLKNADLRRVLQAEEALERQGAFAPTMDPAIYFTILRQWSLWASAQKFSAQDFAREFVDHAKKNALAARQPWNATIETQIRSTVPKWWQDVSRVLSEATKARPTGTP
jgi:hypothetical protein